MNVATLKKLSYLSSIALIGEISYVGYSYYENGQSQAFFDNEETISLLRSVEPPATRERSGLSYTGDVLPAFVEFNWTGEEPEGPPPPGPGPGEFTPTTVPVTDILHVVWISRHTQDEAVSSCLLLVQSVGDIFLGVGDPLPAPHDGISVFAILPNAVEFSFADDAREHEFVQPAMPRGNRRRLIMLTDPDSVREPSGLRFPNSSRVASDAPERTEKRNGIYHVGREDARIFGEGFQRIMSEDVSVETYFKDGKRAGLKVRSVRSSSIAASHGVQEDDIIISINGQSVTSQQEAIQYVNRHSEQTSIWRVKHFRSGAEREVIYRSPN